MISLYDSLLQIEGLVSMPCVICSCLTNCQERMLESAVGTALGTVCMSVADCVSAILFGASEHN